MLKKKIRELMLIEKIEIEKSFELIHDGFASLIIGGKQNECGKLKSCLEYGGNCPDLANCVSYTVIS